MPEIEQYTPAWLSSPNPGYEIFTQSARDVNGSSVSSSAGGKKTAKPGPRRTIAHRGTEVFIAVGKEIRWADLVYLKEAWENKQERSKESRRRGRESTQYDEPHAQGYRTIKTPVADDIRQLMISPNANFLAILTTHTVHIAVLPESSHLTAEDQSPMRLKTYMLGPTTHITTQSSIASALWHPLGVNGTCLVTVTEDAVVRVWELSTADRWSFDRATLAIDLKKLADGTSVDQDFGASVSGTNKGFSPDSFEMEVASACFAGRGSGGWSPMTLWIAMREGDVYALCPLVPEKWSPPPTLIPSLSVSIVAKNAAIEDDPEVSRQAKLLARQQQDWMSDIDNQEPAQSAPEVGGDVSVEIYTRPNKPGRVPKLQGPFDFELAPTEEEEELDTLLADIYVIGAKMDGHELMLGEDEEVEIDEIDQEGLSMGVVCLITSSGRLSICLDLDGVEAQWLPKSKSKVSRFVEDADPPTLLTFEVLETSKSDEVSETSWPMFSPDVSSRYNFFITNTSSITFIEIQWVFRLETELAGSTHGSDFRIDLLAKGQDSTRQRVYPQNREDRVSPLAASTLIRDPDIGYFLLTASPHCPVAIQFEGPQHNFDLARRSRSPTYDSEPEIKAGKLYEPRTVYQPASELGVPSKLPRLLQQLKQGRYKHIINSEVRLSPATLSVLADAHKVLSEETHKLGTAAAELFRRCEILQIELRSQITKVNEVAKRVDEVTGEDYDNEGPAESREEEIQRRLKAAAGKQKDITERLERLRRRTAKGSGRELSEKERAWMEEIRALESKILPPKKDGVVSGSNVQEPWQRLVQVQELTNDLVEQAKGLAEVQERPASRDLRVPASVRDAKMTEVNKLLERETALVEGAKNRLQKLSPS